MRLTDDPMSDEEFAAGLTAAAEGRILSDLGASDEMDRLFFRIATAADEQTRAAGIRAAQRLRLDEAGA